MEFRDVNTKVFFENSVAEEKPAATSQTGAGS
jgi:hypothetical protein